MDETQQAQTEMRAAIVSLMDDIMHFLTEIDKTEALLHELARSEGHPTAQLAFNQRASTQQTSTPQRTSHNKLSYPLK